MSISITNPDFIYTLDPFYSPNNLPVSAYSILGLAPVKQGLELIANHVAKCDLLVNRLNRGGKVPDRKHPAYRLLKRQPQSDMSSLTWKKAIVMQAIVFGNAYCLVDRPDGVTPAALTLLDPQSTRMLRDQQGWFYETTTIDGNTIRARSDNIIHIKSAITYHGWQGYPLIAVLKEALQLSQHLLKYKNTFFNNGGKPSMAILLPNGFKNSDRRKDFQETFADSHGTISKSNKTVVLENGATIQELGQSNSANQLIEMTDQETRTIAQILGIPASFLGIADEYTSHNSLETQTRQFINFCIDGWLTTIEQEIESKVLREVELDNETHSVEFDRSALEDLDESTRTTTSMNKLNNGAISWEEWRTENGYDQNKQQTFFRPLQSARVDDEFNPINPPKPETPAPEPTDTPPDAPQTPQNDKLRSISTKTIARLIERLKRSVEAHAKRGDLKNWNPVQEHRAIFAESLDCFEGAGTAIDTMLSNLTMEVSNILPEQANAIDWTKYQQLLEQVI